MQAILFLAEEIIFTWLCTGRSHCLGLDPCSHLDRPAHIQGGDDDFDGGGGGNDDDVVVGGGGDVDGGENLEDFFAEEHFPVNKDASQLSELDDKMFRSSW